MAESWESLLNARNLKTQENLEQQELKTKESARKIIRISVVDLGLMLLSYAILSAVVSFIFYDNLLFCIFLIPLAYPYIRVLSGELILIRKKNLKMQYMECLNAMANAVDSGYSIEGSVSKAKDVIEILYGRDSLMYKEIVRMEGRLRLGVMVEDVFDEFSKRSGLIEAYDLASALKITKRYGDNISNVLKTVSNNISSETNVENEIEVLISSKKYEHLIMCVVPIFMMLYMRVAAPEIMKYLYVGFGRFIMTICLAGYVFAIYIGIKLLRKTKFE
ncbi:type II secretion system F family protein [Eubacterium uniforme]|nr:type II secretion system F family protein [Eubacterium uniforme]